MRGAGDGTRTRDSLLGRQELYQTELLPLIIVQDTRHNKPWIESGCADSNRGPPGPKPGALPTAPHPADV